MSMEFVAIISASIALAGLIITGQNGLRRELQGQRKEMQEQGISLAKEIKEQRKEMQEQGIRLGEEIKEQGIRLEKKIQEQGNRLEKKIQEQGKEIEGVKIEVAALKATVDTYFRVRVDPPLQSAVAETPEDYDAD